MVAILLIDAGAKRQDTLIVVEYRVVSAQYECAMALPLSMSYIALLAMMVTCRALRRHLRARAIIVAP